MEMRRPWARRCEGGFTLIELLISVILMVILLGAATMIFIQTTDTVATQEARMQVYVNARYALDSLENDLLSCVPFNEAPPPPKPGEPPPQPAIQSFWMDNGVQTSPGTPITYPGSGGHTSNAADRISFRAVVPVGDQLRTAEITYEIIPGSYYVDTDGTLKQGDTDHAQTVNGRGLYTLIRRVRVADPANPTVFTKMPVDRFGDTITDTELCHYVTSFNIEYYDSEHRFSQLDPSPFQSPTIVAPGGERDALGNGAGKNDTSVLNGGTPFRVPFIRVTIVIMDDRGERQQRAIQKTIWVPTG